MRIVSSLLPLALGSALLFATSQMGFSQEKVLKVESTSRILVSYKSLPVYLSLAHVELPPGPTAQKKAIARLTELINGKGVDVLFDEAYGLDDQGAPLVYLREGKTFVNVILVSEGLVRYKPSDNPTTYERLLANAASMAERNQLGLFAANAAKEEPAPENKKETKIPDLIAPPPKAQKTTKPPKKVAKVGERFASELNGRYYYPEGHPALARVHKNRIIYYNDEESARTAGKERAPNVNDSTIPKDDGTLQSAQAVFEVAQGMLAKAQAMPATPERDRAYTEALHVFTDCVRRFSSLVEKDPNNGALAEQLRRAMQLRYGAMKMRRL